MTRETKFGLLFLLLIGVGAGGYVAYTRFKPASTGTDLAATDSGPSSSDLGTPASGNAGAGAVDNTNNDPFAEQPLRTASTSGRNSANTAISNSNGGRRETRLPTSVDDPFNEEPPVQSSPALDRAPVAYSTDANDAADPFDQAGLTTGQEEVAGLDDAANSIPAYRRDRESAAIANDPDEDPFAAGQSSSNASSVNSIPTTGGPRRDTTEATPRARTVSLPTEVDPFDSPTASDSVAQDSQTFDRRRNSPPAADEAIEEDPFEATPVIKATPPKATPSASANSLSMPTRNNSQRELSPEPDPFAIPEPSRRPAPRARTAVEDDDLLAPASRLPADRRPTLSAPANTVNAANDEFAEPIHVSSGRSQGASRSDVDRSRFAAPDDAGFETTPRQTSVGRSRRASSLAPEQPRASTGSTPPNYLKEVQDERFGDYRPVSLDSGRPRDYSPTHGSRAEADRPSLTNAGEYTIQPGDTYWTISRQLYGSGRYFQALSEHNQRAIPDARRMKPGVVIETPTADDLEQRYPDLIPRRSAASTPQSGQAEPIRARRASGPILQVGATEMDREAPRGELYYSATGVPMYRVTDGDTLSGISAKTLGRSARWPEILELNRAVVKDGNSLKIGTELRLPSDATQVQLIPATSATR